MSDKYNSIEALRKAGFSRDYPTALRRTAMTRHRGHQMEGGTDSGCIERGRKEGNVFIHDEDGKPFWANHGGTKTIYLPVYDRERGALKRLAAIIRRYPGFTWYVQGDPRGAALYILRPGDVPAGEKAESFYNRGIAVCK